MRERKHRYRELERSLFTVQHISRAFFAQFDFEPNMKPGKDGNDNYSNPKHPSDY